MILPMARARTIFAVSAAFAMLLFSGVSYADTAPAIAIGTVSGQIGSKVVLPVSFASGTADVSSLQFDLMLPAGVIYDSIAGGAAASGAGKDVLASAISGGMRALIGGLNQTPLASGPLAAVTLDLADGASAGQYALAVSNLVVSDPNGNAVTAGNQPGGITVVAASTTPSSTPSPTPGINSFSASPASITSGQQATLSWNVSGADHITIAPNDFDSTAASSSVVVSPAQTTTYTLTAVNGTASTSVQTTVTVTANNSGGGGGGGGGGSAPVPVAAPRPTPIPTSTTLASGTSSLPSVVPNAASGTVTASGTVNTDITLENNDASGTAAVADQASSIAQLIAQLRTLSGNVFLSANKGRNLTVGSKGNDVWALQVFLMIDGMPKGTRILSVGPTGAYGAMTAAAVAEWQRSVGLPASGYFGSMSRQALAREL